MLTRPNAYTGVAIDTGIRATAGLIVGASDGPLANGVGTIPGGTTGTEVPALGAAAGFIYGG